MPLTGTLTGKYVVPVDSTPAAGTVEIIPSVKVVKDTTGNVILSGRTKVDLDGQGAFSVTLPATDDTALDPSGVTYTVAARLHHTHLPAVVGIPIGTGATVDMADVTSVDPAAPVYATAIPYAEFDALRTEVTSGATGATASATAAQASETAAAASEANAATSEANAASSATAAATSATAAEAVGTTNDTVMTAVAADPGSDFRALQSATYARVAPAALAENLPAPFYLAHRGGPNVAPEGSMTAYRTAAAAGADIIEMDANLLADGTVALMHDTTVDRTTLSAGNVADHTAASWQKLVIDSTGLMGSTGWPTEAPPLWETMLREFGGKLTMAVGTAPGAMEAINEAIEKAGVHKHTVIFSTFLKADVDQAISLGFHARQLHNTVSEFDLPAYAAKGVEFVGIGVDALTQAFVDDCHANGIKVAPWDVFRLWERDYALAMGVDGIDTDNPHYLKSHPTRSSDAFHLQTFFPGHQGNQGSRGTFTAPDEYGWAKAVGVNTVECLGYLQPTDASNYVLNMDVMVTDNNADTTRGAYVGLTNVDYLTSDYRTTNNGLTLTNDGYRFDLRSGTTMGALKIANNAHGGNLNPNVTVTAPALNVWVPYRFTVTPTTVRIERADTAEGQTFTNSETRPLPFVHIGRTVAGVKFRNITVT